MTAPKRPAARSAKSEPAKKAPGNPAKAPASKTVGSKAPSSKAPATKPAKPEKPAKTEKTSQPQNAAAVRPVVEKPPARATLIPKLHKALKAHYKPFTADTSRSLLHQVLHACCLENAPAAAADKAFARVLEGAYDLNEVRVTTVAELAESLQDLPDPARAALSLRRALQSVFESTYSFSLEHARKHSLAHGLRTLENLHGIPPFVIQYVAATALGGHLVPLDDGALAGLYLTGLVTQQEYDAGKVPGLERTISKKAGGEFTSLLHQFGVDCLTNLHGTTVRKIVQTVNPAALDRFPKRGQPLPLRNPPPPPTNREGLKAADAARASAEAHRPAGPQAAARPAGKTPLPPPGSGPKRTADGKTVGGKTGPKPFVVKPNVGKPITIKPELARPQPPAAPAAKPAPPPKSSPPPKSPPPTVAKAGKTPPAKSTGGTAKAGDGGSKSKSAAKPHSQQLAKRKPR
jgi:hypothetical protein